MAVCDYSSIAKQYELWCMGDEDYVPVADFYLSYLKNHSGVFAELGVGTGRVALPLSLQPDVKVYGIDICQAMLEQCREKMTLESNLELVCADFTDFILPEKADVIYMPFRSIGHILNDKELEIFFKNVSSNLKENGIFIFDHYMFSEAWADSYNNSEIMMYDDGDTRIVDHYVFDFENKKIHCVTSCNGEITFQFDFRWIVVDEIHAIYPRYGFALKALYGDFDGSNWTPGSPNQIWVLGKDT
jgi:hypothetical protein